ncbi:cache domain-containing sensor histidine kinase [Paenibacillus agaridevorans]|uniref:cache domain-containing sensor histidine kinase n=1 Tax=Paenibacillus agaridevorans TaxID=171404 RepID=UPI001BE4593E|nr:sensor histidine kinase [Paenibacillus agaridevorans]
MNKLLHLVSDGFKNKKIRSKIMLIYMPLLLLPLFVLGYAANAIYSKAIIHQTTQSFTDNSALIIDRLNGMLTNAESSANMLALNLNRILGAPKPVAEDETYDLPRYNAVTTELALALVVFPDVESIAFVDHAGRIYGSDVWMEGYKDTVLASQAYETIMATNGVNKWLPMEKRHYLSKDTNKPVLTLGKHLYDIGSGNHLGILFLNVREDTLSSVLKEMKGTSAGQYFIVNQQGFVVSSPDKEKLLQPVESEHVQAWVKTHYDSTDIQVIDGEQQLLAIRSFPQLGWKLVSATSLRSLTAGLESLQWTLLAIALLCSVAAIIGSSYLSNVIALPIVELARSMKGFREGDLNIQLKVATRDEMGYLALGFNEMLRRLKELLENVMREQRQKREYELALIQSQIKPHFLYNTLDVIYALSTMGRNTDVQRTTKALADFYRVSLSGGREHIRLEEEIRNVKDYLAIQQIRYSDVFTYEIDIDKSILQVYILKLTLQPLIENAIYHGLKEQTQMGKLLIKGYRSGNRIVIEVADDGVGMSEDQLSRLFQEDREDAGHSSFGLLNVNNRLKLTYGSQYGLQIESHLGKGTVVWVNVPDDYREERDG